MSWGAPVAWLVTLTMGCSEPVPLPRSALPAPAPEARMVRSGTVQGYLAQPAQGEPQSERAILMLVETSDAANRELARESAQKGSTVLLTEAVETTDAKSYLGGLDGVEGVTVVCHRPTCP